jgi:archaellum biogenesis ATPase FlaH
MEKNNMHNFPIRYFSTVTARKVEWLWYPYIPFGKITIVQGDPGDGKTTLVLNIAAHLSNGMSLPETNKESTRVKIIYQSAEDGAEDTLKPRLMSARADCTQIAFIDESEVVVTLNDHRLEDTINEIGARLLVLDPLQAYLSENNEMNRADGIRPIMKQLTAVAERTGCAILIIGHMNKASGSKGIYRGLGSIDITASARSVLLVGRVKNSQSIRVMAQIKNSLAEEGNPIAFEINDNSAIRWIGEYDITVDELLNGEEPQNEGCKISETIAKLKNLLYGGKIPCVQIYAALHYVGISKRSVDRAKKILEIKSENRSMAGIGHCKRGAEYRHYRCKRSFTICP